MARELEPNNNKAQSDILNEDIWTFGSVGTSSDLDSFKISLSSPALLKIHFDSPQENTGRYSSNGDWSLEVVNSAGVTIAANIMDFDGEFSFAVNAGDYYVLIKAVNYLNGEYGIKYTQTPGRYFSSYENDGSFSSANVMINDQFYTGNLYGTRDIDYYKIDLGNESSNITVTFDSPQKEGFYINPPGTENSFRTIFDWTVQLIDSSGNILSGQVFEYDGSFSVSTKSVGAAYIKVFNENVGYFAPSKYRVKYTKDQVSDSSTNNSSTNDTPSSSVDSGSSTSTKLTNQISRENEPNDQEDNADPLDPNWTNGINDENTLTSSHFSKDNIMLGNLSSIGDYDRFWIYMDTNERVQLNFKPPSNSSYEILFLNEATGELVEEWVTNDIISLREGETGNSTYSLYFIAPVKKVYQVVIRATEEGAFSTSDYELSIANFQNPSGSIYTTLSGLNSPDPGQDQIGTSTSETLRGSSKGEWLKGNDGNDTIYGNGGYDVIWGGDGNDIIYAGSGRNTIYVESGTDYIYGGEAIDTLVIPSGWSLFKGVDTFGKWFSIGEKFIYVQSPDQTSQTYASSIEMITILDSGEINSLRNISAENNFFYVYRNKFLEDITIKDKKIEIDLSQFMATLNPNDTTQYSISSNSGPSEKVYINKNILTIDPSDEFKGEAEVTIRALNLTKSGSIRENDQEINDTFIINYKKDDIIIKKYDVSENINSNYNVLSSYDDSTIINKNTLNYSPNDDIITLTNVGTARGLGGNDLYFVSNLITDNARIQIVDTAGSNTIQIPKNTFIDEITFAKKAVKIELSDNIEVTINAADKFIFNLGGNISSGESGTNLTFDEFANLFDISLSDITSTEIINSDFYI